MKGYIFALKKHDYDLHSTVFNLLKANGIKNFTPEYHNTQPIVFHVDGQYIICRTTSAVEKIPVQVQELDITDNDVIKGIVTLPRDLPKLLMDKNQFDEFIEKNGRKPKYSESHKYVRLADEELPEYANKLLQKSGLIVDEMKFTDNGYRLISGRNKSLKAVDVHFKATVQDLTLFEKAWFGGIGRNKTYGFGMIRAVKI